jgi:hypothetical protein
MIRVVDSWPREIKSYEELPEAFRDIFDLYFLNPTPFPYTIFELPDRWGRRKANAKLIVACKDVIYIFEKNKKEVSGTHFCFKDIDYVENGTVLLHSWMTLNGVSDRGRSSLAVEYNTVVENMFKHIVEKFRIAANNLDQSELQKGLLKNEHRKFDYLSTINFKYMNFSRRSIMPGEKVIQIVFQPDLRVKVYKFFQKMLLFTHILILTDHELIIVKDDESLKRTHVVRYGGIWNYIPLSNITSLTLRDHETDPTTDLEITLAHGGKLNSTFSLELKSQVEQLISELKQQQVECKRECSNL